MAASATKTTGAKAIRAEGRQAGLDRYMYMVRSLLHSVDPSVWSLIVRGPSSQVG